MGFKEMDPEKVWELIKGQEDILTPIANREVEVFHSAVCPSCGSSDHSPFIDGARPFVKGYLLPNKLLKCLKCQTEFNPRTNLITRAGITLVRG